jgi:arylsulfatase A-like enzyme
MSAPRFLLALVILSIGIRCVAADDKRPNVLLIYTDDQSYKTLSCYPEAPDWVQTPNIDQLARRGVRFERAYLGAWCMPSRASLLTGHLQHAIQSMRMEGEYPGSAYDPVECPFVPSVLRQNGYQTAQIGKWHTGVDTGYGRDWDFQIVWNRPRHPDNAGNYFYDQIMAFNGKERKVEGYSTDNYTQWALEYIRGQHRKADAPWLLWLCFGAVHGPTTPAERHKGKLAGNTATVPADVYGPWPDKPAYLEKTKAWQQGSDGRPAMRTRPKRDGNFDTDEPGLSLDAWVQQVNECAMALDESVGRLMKALDETGQRENTLVIYVADQGYGLGEHGFSQKVAAYDATIASPLIISRPGSVPEDRVCSHPVNGPDLVDLVCRVTEVKLPWKSHGRDIRPLLEHPERSDWRHPVLMTHTGRYYGRDTDTVPTDERLTSTANVPWYVMLRDANYKYIRTLVEGETEEVYDLVADPEELVNLAAQPEQQPLLRKLRAAAISELRRTDAGFVDSMPASRQMLDAKAGVRD